MATFNTDISDIWWMQDEKDSDLSKIAGGAFTQSYNAALDRQQQQEQFMQTLPLKQQAAQNERDKNTIDLVGLVTKQDLENKKALGYTAIGQVVAKAGEYPEGWNDPAYQKEFWTIASKWPETMKDSGFKSITDNFDLAQRAKYNAELAAGRMSPPTETSKLLNELDAARKAGDTERAKILENKIANSTSGKQMKLEYDDQGRPIFNITEGNVTSTVGDPTVGMRTKAQESIVGLGKSYDLLNELELSIRPEDLGVRGVLGEEVVDRFVAQFAPELASDTRVDNRTKLKTGIQGLVRQISSDTRFSEADRKRAEEAAPSAGMLESHPRAVQSIKTLKGIFAERARRDAQAAGSPIPDYAMSADEIRGQFKEGKMDYNKAAGLLKKYHPDTLEKVE